MATNGSRTMAFQIPEEMFQRIKRHLERETVRTGRKVTQREFVLGLIEEALYKAELESLETEDDGAPEDTQSCEETGSGTSVPDTVSQGK